MKNIVIIGGGTGTFTLLSGLRKFPSNNSVIVSTADNGGSGGKLRYELGVIPPGDYRQCLLGLAYTDDVVKDLFSYRFAEGSLQGHTVGNIIIAALEKITGNIENSIEIAGRLLNIRGSVLPVSLKPTELSAILENGKKLFGEHSIDDQKPIGKASPIASLKLSSAKANPKALVALKNADVIIFGPGDLFTSILPNILVPGIKEAINKSSAKKILVTNIMTKFGQTDHFKASDFVKVLQQYLKGKIDVALVNNKKPAAPQLKRYAAQKAVLVEADMNNIKEQGVEVVAQDLLSDSIPSAAKGDKLQRSFLRHDPEKVAKLIWSLL